MFARPYLADGYQEMAPAYESQMAPAASQPTGTFADPNLAFLYRSPTSNQFYLHYAPHRPAKPTSEAGEPTSGYYSSFYSSQPAASDVSSAGALDSPAYPGQQTSYSDFQGRPALLESGGGASGGATAADQMVPAPSYEQPPNYAQPPRRSGTVTLRLDESTRKRLLEHLRRQQEQLQSAAPEELAPSSTPVQVYVPMRKSSEALKPKQTRSPQAQWQTAPTTDHQTVTTLHTVKQDRQRQPAREQGQQQAYTLLKPNKSSAQTSWRSVPVSSNAGDAPLADGWRSLAITSSTAKATSPSAPTETAARVSRTPNQSSVKVRHPNEVLTDYGLATGDEVTNADETAGQPQVSANAQVSAAPQVSTTRWLAPTKPTGAGANLSALDNKNNVIKPAADVRPPDLASAVAPALPDGPEIVVLDGGTGAQTNNATSPAERSDTAEENGTPRANQQDDDELDLAAS